MRIVVLYEVLVKWNRKRDNFLRECEKKPAYRLYFFTLVNRGTVYKEYNDRQTGDPMILEFDGLSYDRQMRIIREIWDKLAKEINENNLDSRYLKYETLPVIVSQRKKISDSFATVMMHFYTAIIYGKDEDYARKQMQEEAIALAIRDVKENRRDLRQGTKEFSKEYEITLKWILSSAEEEIKKIKKTWENKGLEI